LGTFRCYRHAPRRTAALLVVGEPAGQLAREPAGVRQVHLMPGSWCFQELPARDQRGQLPGQAGLPSEVAEIRYRRFGYVWPRIEAKYRSAIGKMRAIE
jgi:hypothetical protein